MAYLATAPLVLAKDQAGRIHYHYESINPLIPWLSDEQAKHFLAEGLVVEADLVGAPPVEEGEPSGGKPLHAATKAAWVEFAVSKGADPDEAESSTKAELIELYGGE